MGVRIAGPRAGLSTDSHHVDHSSDPNGKWNTPPRGGASEGESKCYVLTRFDAFVLIVTDIGRPTHGHTDGYDGLGLGLNRYVKICMCYRSNSVYTRPGSAYIYAFIYKAQA